MLIKMTMSIFFVLRCRCNEDVPRTEGPFFPSIDGSQKRSDFGAHSTPVSAPSEYNRHHCALLVSHHFRIGAGESTKQFEMG